MKESERRARERPGLTVWLAGTAVLFLLNAAVVYGFWALTDLGLTTTVIAIGLNVILWGYAAAVWIADKPHRESEAIRRYYEPRWEPPSEADVKLAQSKTGGTPP